MIDPTQFLQSEVDRLITRVFDLDRELEDYEREQQRMRTILKEIALVFKGNGSVPNWDELPTLVRNLMDNYYDY
jgi:hypothetical protein